MDALRPQRAQGGQRRDVIKTLIGTFRYPRLGSGMLWEECAREMEQLGLMNRNDLQDGCVVR